MIGLPHSTRRTKLEPPQTVKYISRQWPSRNGKPLLLRHPTHHAHESSLLVRFGTQLFSSLPVPSSIGLTMWEAQQQVVDTPHSMALLRDLFFLAVKASKTCNHQATTTISSSSVHTNGSFTVIMHPALSLSFDSLVMRFSATLIQSRIDVFHLRKRRRW